MKKTNKEAYALAHYIHDWLHVYTISLKGNSPHTVKNYSDAISLFIPLVSGKKSQKFFENIES